MKKEKRLFYQYGKSISNDFVVDKLLKWDSKKFLTTSKEFANKISIRQKKCPICNNTRSKKLNAFFGIDYMRCSKCSHVFVSKRLTDENLNSYYSNIDISSTAGYTNKKSLKEREELFKPKIQFVKKFAKGKNWLDVGAGDGAAITVMNRYGFNGNGLESNIQARQFAKKNRRIDLVPKTLDEIIIENKRWNIISFFGVLEHIPDPISALKNSNQLLEKNGIVVIEVPNYDSISSFVQNLTGIADRHLEPITHIMLFTEKSLKNALKKTGFTPIAVWYYGMDMIELLKYIKKLDDGFVGSELCISLCEHINEFQKIIDQKRRSDFILMIAKKN